MKPDLQFILTYNGVSTTLVNAPDGWDDNFVRWERSTKYWGFFRSFTTQMRFVKEGAEILRDALYTDGLTALASVEIKKLNRLTMVYYTAYEALIDFNTFKDSDYFVDVILVEGGLSKLIKDNESTVYAVPVDWQTSKRFKYNGKWVEYEDLSTLFYNLMDLITGGKIIDSTYNVQTLVLDQYIQKRVLTTSLAAYNQNTLYDIKTSFSDFFKAMDVLFNVGVGVEIIGGIETVIIAEKDYFFSNSVIATFENVTGFNAEIAKDLLFSTVKIGFPVQEKSDTYDTLNEPNTTSNFRSPLGGITQELDLVTTYRADFTGFKEAFDTDMGDGVVFLVDIYLGVNNPYIPEPKPGYLRKINSATLKVIYNAAMTPRQLLVNRIQYINSCLFANGTISFLTSGNDNANNKILVSGDPTTGEWVNEADNIGVTAGQEVIFYPVKFTITVPMPYDFDTILENATKGKVRFEYLGVAYYGYILDIKVKLAGKSEAEINLLATYDNNLLNLIR